MIAGIRRELATTGRHIDEDRYGATLVFRFGDWHEPEVAQAAAARSRRASGARDFLAVGDAGLIEARIREYVEAGASKFVLIPLARGDEALMEQTRRLVSEVMPAVEATQAV